jgi:hypothetical protein
MNVRIAEIATGSSGFATAVSEGLGAMTQAIRRNQTIEKSVKTWEAAVDRYFTDFLADSESTLKALAKCRGPVDVLAVEQQWLRARAQAYLDSGLRFAKAFSEVASALTAHEKAAAPAEPAPISRA